MLRFHYTHPDTGVRARERLELGTESEGWNDHLARRELERRMREVRAGTYRPAVVVIEHGDRDPPFREFATEWLAWKRTLVTPNTYKGYENLLVNHLLPFFAGVRLSEITFDLLLSYHDERLATSKALQDAAADGTPLTRFNPHGVEVVRRTFEAGQINGSIALLSQILRRAVKSESYDVARNVADDRELHVPTPKRPARRHVEADEFVELLIAALELDEGKLKERAERAETVRELRDRLGLRWAEIALRIRQSESTAIALRRWHPPPMLPRGRRALVALLGLSGLRSREAATLRWQDLSFDHMRITVHTTKSQPHLVAMLPFLAEELLLYRLSIDVPPRLDDIVFPTRTTGPRDRGSMNLGLVGPVVRRVAQRRAGRGAAPLPPSVTPQVFRRTFVTMAAQAGRSLSWVQAQVGHADPITTMRHYQQASSAETQPLVRRCLDVLFQTRPVIGLDNLEMLMQIHRLDRFLGRGLSE